MYPKYPVHAKSIQVLGILVQSIFAFDLTLFRGNTIFSPGGSVVCLVSLKKVTSSTLWGKIIFGHAHFLIWAKI